VDQKATRWPPIQSGATIYRSCLKGRQGVTPFLKVTASHCHLEESEGMERDFIEVYQNALSPELCREIRHRFEASEQRMDGQIGLGIDKSKKQSTDVTITGVPEWSDLHNQILDSTLRHLILYSRKYSYMVISMFALSMQHLGRDEVRPLNASDIEAASDQELGGYLLRLFRPGAINIQKYAKGIGGYYYWHSEIYPRDPSAETLHRVLFFIFYLNDVEVGGETEFLYQNKKIKTSLGSMVIAPAGFTHTHKGCIPVSCDKYILTSWILFNRAEQIYGEMQ
jgi:hypothetical protein